MGGVELARYVVEHRGTEPGTLVTVSAMRGTDQLAMATWRASSGQWEVNRIRGGSIHVAGEFATLDEVLAEMRGLGDRLRIAVRMEDWGDQKQKNRAKSSPEFRFSGEGAEMG